MPTRRKPTPTPTPRAVVTLALRPAELARLDEECRRVRLSRSAVATEATRSYLGLPSGKRAPAEPPVLREGETRADAVLRMRAEGHRWETIGDAFGLTRQWAQVTARRAQR